MGISSILTRPEFYDIFGLPTFIFITATALWTLKTKGLPLWISIALLAIGVLGMLVDSFNVYMNFLK